MAATWRRGAASSGGGGGGGRGLVWLLALVAAGGLIAVRYSPTGALAPVRAAVAAAAGTGEGTPASVAALFGRVERVLRRGLDGRGWRWPPISGGTRVEVPPPATPPLRYPVAGAILLPFGPGVDPLTGQKVQMDGLLLGTAADAPVRAPAAGTVVTLRDGPAVGEEIVLAVAGRTRLEVDLLGVTAIRVRAGQTVARGQLLGRVSAVGPRTVPHLVVEVRLGGIAVDPLSPLFFGAQA